MKPQQLIAVSQWINNEAVRCITPTIIGARPNTYTYTKAMAEYMLVEEYADLPIAIVRPTIVTSAWKEPIPGWIDNYNGLAGMFVAMGKGLVRLTPCHGEYTVDLIPVDIVINLLIAVGWHTGINSHDSILTYNCTSGGTNPIKWDDVARYIYPQMIKNPLNSVLRNPTISFERNRLLVAFGVAMDHYMPAYLLDMLAWFRGKKRRMVQIQDKLQKAVDCLGYFRSHQWKFTNDNLTMVRQALSQEDQKLFPFDIAEVSWQPYMQTIWFGIKTFLLEEEVSRLPAARRKLRRAMAVSQACNLFKMILLWRILATSSGVFHRLSLQLSKSFNKVLFLSHGQ